LSYIKRIEETLKKLVKAIDDESSQEKLSILQKDFSQAVKQAMKKFQKGKISVKTSESLPLVMFYWVTEKLPIEIQDQKNLSSIKNELILFDNTINQILKPEE
jgi:hypothetical protein